MDDLICEFVAETSESLGVLDQQLVTLERTPGDKGILGNIFRVMHTIKGTSGFLGLPRLAGIAHSTENLLSMMRDGELEATSQTVTVVLESLDQIKIINEFIGENGKEPEGDDTVLITKLENFASRQHVQDTQSTDEDPKSAPPDRSTFFAGDDELNALIEKEKAQTERIGAACAAVSPPALSPEPEATLRQVAEANDRAPAPSGAAPSHGSNTAAGTQSIRVNLDILENLMQMVSELVLNRNQLMQIVRTNMEVQEIMQSPVQQMSYITSELQEGIMKTRMQPISVAWAKFPRLIRDLSHDLGKKIELRMIGEETELDRQLLELIKDPLTHMVRNSCDHGLERPEDRLSAGKPESGTVTLSAQHEGGHIIIKIIDDGRGLNLERIKEKAVANGVVTPSVLAAMSPQQIMQFIFAPGFSTAEKVTSVSGRGVGMDVVRTNIEKIGGAIEINSEPGKGSEFIIKIPLTLAIVSVLIVEVKGLKFAIPQLNVLEMVAVAPGTEYEVESINRSPVLRLREKLLPLGSLGEILGLQDTPVNWEARHAHVVVCRVGSYEFGLLVDCVHDTEEIVVKPVTELLKDLSFYAGNTILGDGSVIMILDPNGIVRSIDLFNTEVGSQKSQSADLTAAVRNEVNFLLFQCGEGALKAVPLELIARLEEIDVGTIEKTGHEYVVQYRDELMRLRALGDFQLPATPLANVIVFSYDRKNIGLMVDKIIDIVKVPYDIQLKTSQKFCLGSMVIEGKTTDIVDVAELLSDLVAQAVNNHALLTSQEQDAANLLLVEDSLFFRNIAEPFLSAAGYNVTSAENGQDALDILMRRPHYFHAIVSDIEMPVMNGIEFAQQCRKSPSMANIPIIAYTASYSPQTAQKCLQVGMQDCIIKTDRPGLLNALANVSRLAQAVS